MVETQILPDGLIFYDVDNDKLARKVGKTLEENPPKGIKVIRYTDEKNFQGLRKYIDKFTYVEDFIDSLENRSKDFLVLQELDSPIFDHVCEWEKEQMKKHNVKFSMELHDTPCKRKRPDEADWNINIDFSAVALNKKLSNLLFEYYKCRTPIIKRGTNVLCIYRSDSSHVKNPYHQITVEISHDPLWIEEPKAIEDCCFVIRDLSKYMRKEYPKLWKKWKKQIC